MNILPETQCPHCTYKVNAATATDGDGAPKPGDFSICIKCTAIAIFDDTLALRKLTREERDLAIRDTKLMATARAARIFLANQKGVQ